ncbi:MAG: hypothetical protein GY953_59175 [bacterium]|nr:hypothetical protein [bacterium]
MKRFLVCVVLSMIVPGHDASAQTREKFGPNNPNPIRNKMIHGQGDIASNKPGDILRAGNFDGAARITSPQDNIFNVTFPVVIESFPRVLAVSCEGKGVSIDGEQNGEDGRVWRLDGCRGKMPRFSFSLEGESGVLNVRPNSSPSRAKKGVAVLFITNRKGRLVVHKETTWADSLVITEFDRRLDPG